MPPDLPRKHTAEELIVDTAVDRLRNRTADGKELAELEDVLRGDADANPKPPMVWIGDGEVRLQSGNSIIDNMQMDLILQCDVKSLDPEEGSRRARRLAALAADQLLINDEGIRDAKLGLNNFVTNVEFYRSERGPKVDQTIYTHITVVRVSFRVIR